MAGLRRGRGHSAHRYAACVLVMLFLVFVVAPVVELAVFLQVADIIGVWPAVLAVLALSLFGVWVFKRAGIAAMRRTRAAFAAGEVPTVEVVDGLLTMFAGLLLIAPGFVSDIVALVLLVPVMRTIVRKRIVRDWMVGRRVPGFVRSRSVVDVQWVGDVTPRPGRPPIELGPPRD